MMAYPCVRVGTSERKEFIMAFYSLNNSSKSWVRGTLLRRRNYWNSSCTKLEIAAYFNKSCSISSPCSKLLEEQHEEPYRISWNNYYLLEVTTKKPVNSSHWSWNVPLVSEKQIQTISKCKRTVYLLSLRDSSAIYFTPSISNMKAFYLQTHL